MSPYMSKKPPPAKTALCFGLNYPGTDSELAGCVNDARDWHEMLSARGYTALTAFEPTAEQMRGLLASRIRSANGGDSVVITYSGHGTYIRDTDGDEPDGRDECLCPADCFSGNLVTDDELFDLFSERKPGVKLLFVSDSCHSGTVARFRQAGQPVDPKAPKVRFLPPAALDLPRSLVPATAAIPVRRKLKSSALLMSGCQDTEYSYDAWFGDRANGAFTRTALDALATLPAGASVKQWHAAIQLPTPQYPQRPNLMGTSSQRKWKVP